MNRKFFRIVIIFFIIIILLNPSFLYALEYPELNSQIVEIYDLTDEKVIYEVDSFKETSIASLTKIATTITAIETISNLDEEVTITWDILNTVPWDASKAGLQAGDYVTYRDLLYASMLPSGADATNSIAILSSGSIDNFVIKMNELAKNLELNNTHFVNVTGLDEDGHYSTADDVRKLLSYALKNELFRDIYTTREYTLSNGLEVESTIIKYNTLSLFDTSSIMGSKTGYTGEAGYCLSSLSNINSHEFIIIVLKAQHIDDYYYNIIDSVNLIQFLLDHYQNQILVKKGDIVKAVPIKLSKEESYNIRASSDIFKYLPSDYKIENLRVDYSGLESLSFIHKVGDKIGTISYYYDNELIAQEDILLNTKISISFIKVLKTYWYSFIGILLTIIFLILRIKRKNKKNKE